MSSLPQGWHGVPRSTLTKNAKSSSTSAISSAPTVRKKWSSPQSATVLCKSKLPSYHKSSFPPLPNGCQSRTTPPRRNSASLPKVATENSHQSELSLKSSRDKEMQSEIASLKKEIATLKAENSILKARVRRVDDENSQKTRQVERLRAELQNATAGNTASNKSKKDSESLLLLRQKCLRLEGALKEKELALKNLRNEAKSMKMDELKGLVESYKEMAICDGPGDSSEQKNHRLLPLCNGKIPSSKQGVKSTVRDHLSSRTEVNRLRDMFHKVQEENRVLIQQGKEKDQEIRQLKLQLQRLVSKPSTGNRPVSTSSSNPRTLVKAHSESTKKLTGSSVSLVRERRRSSTQSTSSQIIKPSRTVPALQKRNLTKEAKPTSSKTVSSGSTFVVTKVNNESRHKGLVKKQQKPIVTSQQQQQQANENDIESRVKDMRENIAARKIQRSWREHRKKVPGSSELTPEEVEAVSYIRSVLIDYKTRMDKLKKIASQEGTVLQLQDDEERSIVLEVQATAKQLWS